MGDVSVVEVPAVTLGENGLYRKVIICVISLPICARVDEGGTSQEDPIPKATDQLKLAAAHFLELSPKSFHRKESVDFTTDDDEQVRWSVAATAATTNTRPPDEESLMKCALGPPLLLTSYFSGKCTAFSQDGQPPITNAPNHRNDQGRR